MKHLAAVGFAASSLLIAEPALAAPCEAVRGEAVTLSLDDRDEDFLRGVRLGLLFGLTPPSFPQQNIEETPDACSRGEFDANGQTYRIFGDDTDAPPRWAIAADGRIAYLAVMPPPNVVLDWVRRGAQGSLSFRTPPLYVLAVTNGDTREIFAIFEDMPGDTQLMDAFKAALEGRIPRMATFDVTTGETTFTERQAL